MRLRHILFVVILAMLLGLAIKVARAEEVIETWRNPFGAVYSVSVNPADSSVWVASGGSVLHLAADGTILRQIDLRNLPGFDRDFEGDNDPRAGSVSANPTDGSCWVACGSSGEVLHLSEQGRELLRRSGFRNPKSVSVNPADGSCWVAGGGNAQVVHLAADGTELWRGGDVTEPRCVSVNPTDGSCWVADAGSGGIVHLAADGTELWQGEEGTLVYAVAVNPTDGSCWAVEWPSGLLRLSADGTELWRREEVVGSSLSVDPTDASCWVAGVARHVAQDGSDLWQADPGDVGGLGDPTGNSCNELSVDPTDGSCWVADRLGCRVVHLARDGTLVWQGQGLTMWPGALSVNPADGSCWVIWAGAPPAWVVHFAEDGRELWRAEPFEDPRSVSVNPADGSCWVSSGSGEVVHLAADGTELWRGGYAGPWLPACSVSVNPTDGSCWVAHVISGEPMSGEVVHLAADGTELWRGGEFVCTSVSANAADGSCWVTDFFSGQVVHLSADGTVLWRGGEFSNPYAVCVDPADGSCWVTDSGNGQVVHLAATGAELLRCGGFADPTVVAANPTDGSCWVGECWIGRITHLAADGAVLWRGGGFGWGLAPDGQRGIAVNTSDGSCWVAANWSGQVVHLVIWFDDVPIGHWAFDEVKACVDADIVGGYSPSRYEPTWPVARDQMAVFISRSISTPTGEMSLDDYVPPTTPSFSDVPTDFWCYKYIEYAVEHDIVGGYGDGTYQPQVTIDRGQMAVFIARAIAGDDESVPDPTGEPSFPDVPADFWSYRHIEYIADQEVAGGYYDGLYHPETFVTRDQMAVFICRAFHLT